MEQELLRDLADSSRRSQALLETLVERMSPPSPPSLRRSQSALGSSPPSDISIATLSSSEDECAGDETGLVGQRIIDAKHDVVFFFEDGSHRILVADVMFRVHGYLLTRESSRACQLFDQSTDCVDGVVVLEDFEVHEFRAFLSVLYCRAWDPLPLQTKEDWTAVLKVAHRWGLVGVHALAVKRLHDTTSSVDKIVLANEYGVREWLKPAYLDLCQAPSLPSEADCERLGLDIVLKIGRAREAMRFTKLFICVSTRTRIVEEEFRLEEPQLSAPVTAEVKDRTVDDGLSKPMGASALHSQSKPEHPPSPSPAASSPSPNGDPLPSSPRPPTPPGSSLDFDPRPSSPCPPPEKAAPVPPPGANAPLTSWWAESEDPSRPWSPLPATLPAAASPPLDTTMMSENVVAASEAKTTVFPVVEEDTGPITMNSAQPLDRSSAAGQAGSSVVAASQATAVPPVEEPVTTSIPPAVLGGKKQKKKKKGVLHTAALAAVLL